MSLGCLKTFALPSSLLSALVAVELDLWRRILEHITVLVRSGEQHLPH